MLLLLDNSGVPICITYIPVPKFTCILIIFINLQKKKQRSRSRQKKLKAYDMSLLGELLPETTVSEQKVEAKLNCKSVILSAHFLFPCFSFFFLFHSVLNREIPIYFPGYGNLLN
jgi:hypothetical protein